jgi:FkbM family methyltransferase
MKKRDRNRKEEMNKARSPELRMIRLLGRIPGHVPDWSKPILRPFSGMYSKVYRRVWSSIKEEKLVRTPMGPLIYVNYWDSVEREIANGTYERRYIDLFRSKIREGDVVVDVGAYSGIFSLIASEQVGSKGCVYAFEPVPRSYHRLMRNIGINEAENIKAYNLGLSDKDETLPISVPRKIPAEATFFERSATEISQGVEVQKDIVQARLIPFDWFYNNEELNKVNVVKIDAEGAELKVLKGMENTIRSNSLELFIEIFPPMVERIGGSLGELATFLTKLRFTGIYSTESNSGIGMDVNNVNEVIEFIRNGGHNFILSKKNY